ncbi:glycosyl-4,4'-diaponeurosporenoate acyltransferase [Paenibacillus aurantius]|uniref:Glycosyl-4,4'-diaponeurosporenoate acyltransferase n=1 Tax=Paenibacillus aurantius TaxID=2918900 RepID=A0AA96LAF6_9BACL|nr:glycosyl-4,4'-diaponeurosporenoate acyltransferase [Paenibacillus aurantius]WNQ10026.1 glycosyl-4,4'-diaponeurosporenoate acyltransferase [Paenibacillus aurantius]
MRVLELPALGTLLLDIAAWLAIQLAAAYGCLKAPDRWFRETRWLRPWGLERGGRLYERGLAIKRWKGWLPDGGSWFKGGFSKKKLRSADSAYLSRFLLETRRAEVTHWLAMAPAPLFFLWNDRASGWILMGYALAANLPCIWVQRYNRIRLGRISSKTEREGSRCIRSDKHHPLPASRRSR